MNGEMRAEDKKFIDWDHYRFTLWQTQLNFAVFCASSACGVSVEHMDAKKQMIGNKKQIDFMFTVISEEY